MLQMCSIRSAPTFGDIAPLTATCGVACGVACALAAFGLASPAQAQTPPDYGIEWRTIGLQGGVNRPVSFAEGPNFYDFNPNAPLFRQVGGVSYEYRMSRTEITATQWYEFVQAYEPYWRPEQSPDYVEFTSGWVARQGPHTNGQFTYSIVPGGEQMPVDVGWRMAARYCNWLHNGKAAGEWAFQTGAYDTSTFTRNPDGSVNDQAAHTPGARFWIPTLDEWTKGMHWDPAKNNGEGGYWIFPTSSDTAPITGLPVSFGGDGTAQTSAGIRFDGDPFTPYIPVGQYPDAMSPWGLLDGSGGFTEWTETRNTIADVDLRGSSYLLPPMFDPVDFVTSSPTYTFRNGLRVASIVPPPSSGGVLCLVITLSLSRRRQPPCVGDVSGAWHRIARTRATGLRGLGRSPVLVFQGYGPSSSHPWLPEMQHVTTVAVRPT